MNRDDMRVAPGRRHPARYIAMIGSNLGDRVILNWREGGRETWASTRPWGWTSAISPRIAFGSRDDRGAAQRRLNWRALMSVFASELCARLSRLAG
jgi:hypothetical protein